ncbi:MAG: hypothetical protein GXO67_04655 [Archaeoglobi archaeon]|nr:hypothetical protein [Archaeoglobi archaeon]
MHVSSILRGLAVALLALQLVLDVGIFFGISLAQSISVIVLPLTNFTLYFGLSTLLLPLYGRNYSNFWHMAVRRGFIPVLLSALLYLPLLYVIYSIASLLSFRHMNEPQLISLTILTVFSFHGLAVLRALLELRAETPEFAPSAVNVALLLSLAVSSILLTQPVYMASSWLFSSPHGWARDLAFAVRLFLPSVPAALLSIPFMALLHPPKPSERKPL